MIHAVARKVVNSMQTKTNRKAGFTLVEIMIVVAIIGLLAAIAIPNFVKARQTAQQNTCIANLKQIDGAKEQWALENKKSTGDDCTMADLVGATSYIKNTPKCPATDADYTVDVIGTAPTCAVGGTHILPQ
jgi:prepilin-type N-terminal cleavage/methylation domain-containing protein